MRHVRFISATALIVLAAALSGIWFICAHKPLGHAAENYSESNLPSQAQRAAVIAMIPQQGVNLYSLPDSQVQNLTRLPQVNSSTIDSMIVHLKPVSIPEPAVLGATAILNRPALTADSMIVHLKPVTTSQSLVSESTAILNLPALTVDHVPTISDVEHGITIDPLQLALQIQPTDTRLINWLQNWRANFAAGNHPSDTDRSKLADILSQTPLTWLQIYYVGEAFYNTTGDEPTTAIFYLEVVARAHESFSSFSPGASEIRPALLAMHKTKNVLWDMTDHMDTDLGRRAWQAEWTLNCDLIKYVRPGDPVLEFAREHGKIGIIECYHAAHHEDKAIAYAQSIDLSQMTQEERISVAWQISNSLLLEHRNNEAAEQLKIVIGDPQFKYYQDAIAELRIMNNYAN